ncbi:MAG: DUF4920 domain-containing protein [Bacteroidetes bacterium]|jgi:hypothetical protein|nr:DUF4920 domain-containing protein [Bacteroidota bacterium]
MKQISLFLTLSFALLMFGLSKTMVAQDKGSEEQMYFGEKISPKKPMKFKKLHKKMQKTDGMNDVKVRGTVTSVCQAKGCWMTIADGDKEMFVKFKDYGFFMPKDIAGREVIMEGTAYREVVSVDELQHLAKDAGKSEDEIAKITEPKEELQFLAHGVILVPEGGL